MLCHLVFGTSWGRLMLITVNFARKHVLVYKPIGTSLTPISQLKNILFADNQILTIKIGKW